MKNMALSVAILSALFFLSGCQNSENADSSAQDQGAGDQVAMNDGGAAPGGAAAGGGDTANMMMGGTEGMEGYGNDGAEGTGNPGDDPMAPGYGEYAPEGTGYGEGGEDSEKMMAKDYANQYPKGYAGGEGAEKMENPADFPEGYGTAGPGGPGEAEYGGLGEAGYGGPGGPGGGNSGPPPTEEGTAKHAVVQTIWNISQGKQEGLDAFISSRAKGPLAELRTGKMAKEKFDALKNEIGQVQLLSDKGSGTSRRLSLKNEEGRIFRFTCKKEKDKYVITEFVNKAPTKRSRAAYNKRKK